MRLNQKHSQNLPPTAELQKKLIDVEGFIDIKNSLHEVIYFRVSLIIHLRKSIYNEFAEIPVWGHTAVKNVQTRTK